MEKITKVQYKALDGTLFNTEDDCVKHDELVKTVNEIIGRLNPIPPHEGCGFENGEGYIQQDIDVVDKAKKDFTNALNKHFGTEDNPYGFGFMGRVLDDSDMRTMYGIWGRLSNIDKFCREWGQGYYAANPTKGVQQPFIGE